eukprot:456317_1
MSVQCGVTQSSPITRLANSYRPTEHVPRYYDLSGSSQWNSNNATYSNNNTVTSPINNYYSNTQVLNTSPTHNTHNTHNHTTKNAVVNTSMPSTNNINAKVQYLQRCDGTIISP